MTAVINEVTYQCDFYSSKDDFNPLGVEIVVSPIKELSNGDKYEAKATYDDNPSPDSYRRGVTPDEACNNMKELVLKRLEVGV